MVLEGILLVHIHGIFRQNVNKDPEETKNFIGLFRKDTKKSPEISLLEDDEQLLLGVSDAGVHPYWGEGTTGSPSAPHHRTRHGNASFSSSANTLKDKMVGLFVVECPHFLSLAR